MTVLAVIIALTVSSCMYKKPAEPDPTPVVPSNTASNTEKGASDAGNASDNSDNTAEPSNNSKNNTGSNTAPAEDPNSNVVPADPRDSIEKNTNENNTVLIETKYADRSYIDETLFLGDSNTAKYLEYTDEHGQPYTTVSNNIGIYSMGIEHIQVLHCMSFKTGTFTMPDSVSILQPRRMIIMFGTNNLKDYGVQGAAAFADYYAAQIKVLSDAYPNADIIINSVPPATSDTAFWSVEIETIKAFNDAIKEMCKKNGWKFLNSFEALIDGTGYANPELFEGDGIHLNQKGVDIMFDYIRSHALYTEDRRTTPLKDIPEINGPLTRMLIALAAD